MLVETPRPQVAFERVQRQLAKSLRARPVLLGGVREEECGALLQEFFRARR